MLPESLTVEAAAVLLSAAGAAGAAGLHGVVVSVTSSAVSSAAAEVLHKLLLKLQRFFGCCR